MLIYDGVSDISWVYTGRVMTARQMMDDPETSGIFDGPAVLMDDGSGNVYSWAKLSDMCAMYAVPCIGNPEEILETCMAAAKGAYKAPGVAEVEEKADAAQTAAQTASETAATAQSTADEAKATAQTAAEGANPQVATFARMQLPAMAATMTDEQAISVSTLWPEWSAASVAYKVDDVVRHADHLWRCEQAHTSQESWTPDAAPSLWSQIDIAGDGVDVWTQPTGAHNAYNTGDRVHYPTASDPIYVSLIDGNVWSPDAYPAGWQLED